jgi:uncharacterized protein YyaL (SSP411 family)
VLVLFVTSIGPTETQNNISNTIELENNQITHVAQEQQNISSYLDFALAAGGILADKLVNIDDGRVFHQGDFEWNYILNGSALTDYFCAISSMSKIYNITGNATIYSMIGKMATKMVEIFADPVHPGFFVNTYDATILTETKRAGIQAYAYKALTIAESVDPTLDFTIEKQSAITCLADMLYDTETGGFYFFTMRNGSHNIDDIIAQVYPADGKRLDHLALGISALYDAGENTGNTTLTAMANKSLDFMIKYMPYINETDHFFGLRLSMNRTGGEPDVNLGERPARTVLSDINALAIRALVQGYQITGNTTFLDWAKDTVDAILIHNWDQENGAWFSETLDGEPFDPTFDEDVLWYKYSEIQFQMVLALEDLFESTLNQFYIQLVIDTLDLAIAKLWDSEYGGFFAVSNREGLVISNDWKIHYAAVQGFGILALERVWSFGLPIVSYVRVSPANPRPTDVITILVTASDSDGIDSVFANLSIDYEDGPDNITLIEIPPNLGLTGTFNVSIGTLPDGARINFHVIVNDTLGNVFVAGNYFFNVKIDVYEPVVLLRTIYPSEEVREGENVFIEFGTYEYPIHGAIDSCQLHWKVNDGEYTSSNMTWYDIDGDYMVWLIDIGQFYGDDVITYYCVVVDESGNVGTSAFYRLTILGPPGVGDPLTAYQAIMAIGLVAAPGIAYAVTRARKGKSMEIQRERKKAQRRRSRRRAPTRKNRND